MMNFEYRARDYEGRIEGGFVAAENEILALDILKVKGLRPHLLRPRKKTFQLSGVAKRARLTFLRGYASLARAGLSNEQVVDFLADAVRTGQSSGVLRIIKRSLVGMRRDIARVGATMGEAMLNQPALFTSVDAAIVDASYRAGRLPETLEMHADQLEADLDFEGELVSSVLGPSIALIIGLLLFPAIAGVLTPVLQSLFKDFQLTPPPTFSTMVAISDAAHGPYLWGAYAIVAIVVTYAARTGTLRPLVRHVPIIGAIMKANSTSVGARTLGQAYQSGKSAATACLFASSVVEDPAISRAFTMCADDLERGRVASIAEAMSRHSTVFDPLFVQYMRMARESRIPEMCVHVSSNCRRQIRDAVKRLPIIVSNGATLFIGGFVGLMAFYVYSAVSYAIGHINSIHSTAAASGLPH
jgi:type II secretory pathway component PulF